MKKEWKALNADIGDFISQLDRLKLDEFNYRVSKAKSFADKNTSIKQKKLIDLITMEQDGSYPGLPTYEEAQLGVHVLWALSESVDALLKVAEKTNTPWYVKTEALKCLRLTTKDIPWPKVLKFVKNKKLENEVKKAALSSISFHNRKELLPYLKTINLNALRDDYFTEELHKHIVFTRAALGDKDVIIPLLEYRNDPWSSTRQPATAAWKRLAIQVGGESDIAEALLEQSNIHPRNSSDNIWLRLQKHNNKTVLQWAISEASASILQTENCLDFLSSSIWAVRKSAADWLIKHKTDSKHLLNIVSDTSQERIAQSWAAYVLSEISEIPTVSLEPYLENQDVFKKPWKFETPEVVRDSIIKHYVPDCESGTDIRYNIEHRSSERNVYATAILDRDGLIADLKRQGLSIEFCKSIGEVRQQGGGTYWVAKVKCENTNIYLNISTIGKFIDCAHQSKDFEFLDSSPQAHPNIMLCKTTAEGLGFLWLESPLLDNYVPDLNVYFFGDREPLQIRDLLFYWQD